MGIRVSFSKGEIRIYVGANKHYGAVLTGIQNCWSDGLGYSGKPVALNEFAVEREKYMVETTIDRLLGKKKKAEPGSSWIGSTIEETAKEKPF